MRKFTVLVTAILLATVSGVAAVSAKAHHTHSAAAHHKRAVKSPVERPGTHLPIVPPDAYRA